jgi:hypothetical protein
MSKVELISMAVFVQLERLFYAGGNVDGYIANS